MSWFSSKIEHKEVASAALAGQAASVGQAEQADADDHDREQTQTQTQTQEQEQEQEQTGIDTCIHVHNNVTSRTSQQIDPLTLYKVSDYGHQSVVQVGKSNLLPSLRKTGIHVSPLLMFYFPTHGRLERAFAVLTTDASTNQNETEHTTTVVLCTLVELWAKKLDWNYKTKKRASNRMLYSSYTAHGFPIGKTSAAYASDDDVLFGRFLCGDRITTVEQTALFGYMQRRYSDSTSQTEVSKVIACLAAARVMPPPTGLLHILIDQPKKWASHDASVPPPDVAFVRALLPPTYGAEPSGYGARKPNRARLFL